MNSVSSSGRPRKTVENASPKPRASMDSLRRESATRKPRTRPTGRVASASLIVSQAPAAISSASFTGDTKTAGANAPAANPPDPAAGSTAVDVEGKILLVDLLIGPVGADFRQRLVELVAQRRILLADGDAGALAVDDRVGF